MHTRTMHDSFPVSGHMEPFEVQTDSEQVTPSYQEPHLFELGTAVELLRSSSDGNAKDSQNWYVYP